MRRIAVVLALVLAACGGGGGGDEPEAASSDSPTSTTATAADADESTTSTTAAATAAGEAPSTTAAPSAGQAASASAPASAGPTPLAPGTYHYRQEGSTKVGADSYDSPPEGTSVVDAPNADGTQVVHRYIDPEGKPSDATMRFGPDGIFMLETVVRAGGTEVRCTFDPPLATPAWPPTVGATSSGHGECGSFTTDVKSEITEARSVTLDGRTYDAVVVRSTITTTGQFQSTSNQVDWFVPELRLSTHTETTSKGSFGAFTFESTGSSDLLSATPT